MGTLRLAAILPLPALKAVSQKLESVEKEISSARNLTHELIQLANSPSKPTKEIESRETTILSNLGRIQSSMARLSEGSDPKDVCEY
jgi:hypothetical protein